MTRPASMCLVALTAGCPTEVDDTGPVPWTAPDCPSFADPESQGTLDNGSIDEASGIVASVDHPDVYWVHNDSGDTARLFAVGATGADLATVVLTGATAVDWEDIARSPAPGGASWLFAADIGDNLQERSGVTVWRIEEPADVEDGEAAATGFALTYPDGPHNAETLLVDPLSGDLLIVVKSDDGVSPVFRAGAPLTTPATLEQVGLLQFGVGGLGRTPWTTGGDVSPDGRWVLIVTYTGAFLWPRDPAEPLNTAFDHPACEVPRALELQGEAVGFTADGVGYLTVSEGAGADLYLVAP